MIYRTLSEAQQQREPCSWKQTVIYVVKLPDGRTFYRTTTFDTSAHKCKRCRHAQGGYGDERRLHSTRGNETCTICGNPFCGYVRQMRRRLGQAWQTVRQAWTESGHLH